MTRIFTLTAFCLWLALPGHSSEARAVDDSARQPDMSRGVEERRRQSPAIEAQQAERNRRNRSDRNDREATKWCGDQSRCRRIYGIAGAVLPLLLGLFKFRRFTAALTGDEGFVVRLLLAVRHLFSSTSQR